MVLYSANISKLAVPVKSVSRKKIKEIELEPTHVEEVLVPPKKKMSKKQLENLAKGQAALAAKRAAEADAVKTKAKKQKVVKEVEQVKEEPVPEVKKKIVRKKKVTEEESQVEEEIEEKPKAKRIRVKKLKEPEVESEELEVKEKEPPKKKVKKIKDASEPPAWFNQYVATVKKEEASMKTEKVSAKQMKEDVKEVANQKWNDGLTRDRVTNEVDNHMSRMYSQIFART